MDCLDAEREPAPRYTVAEFFCGCGGFSHGFARTGRFDVVLGIDIKKAALRTFRANHTGARGVPETIANDIREVTVDEVRAALARKGVAQLDVLIGGPPCQGFSQMRRSAERDNNNITKFGGYDQLDQDPRNDLVLRFLELASDLNPKCIVIENVPQMRTHQYKGVPKGLAKNVVAILEAMDDRKYHVTEPEVLNAANYGVPQLRERVIFLASRVGPVALPTPTHADPDTLRGDTSGKQPWVTVQQALADLPAPATGPEDDLGGGDVALYSAPPSDYGRLMRSTQHFPYNHVTRAYQARITRLIEHMRPGETWDSASERMRAHFNSVLATLQHTDEKRDDALTRLDAEGHVIKAFYKRYYWSAYTRLAWDKPALTITANANFLGSGRFTHPDANRGITMREAARLQSFDDDFIFITNSVDDPAMPSHAETDVAVMDETCPPLDDPTSTMEVNVGISAIAEAAPPLLEGPARTTNIGVGMDMIGEAVPPLLAEAIARQLLDALDHSVNIANTRATEVGV